MSTDIRRLVFGASDESAFHHGTQFPVHPADIAHRRKASVSDAGTLDLHGQPVQAKKHEVVS